MPVAIAAAALSVALAGPARAEGSCLPHGDRAGWLVPDFVKLQTGGYLGLVTIGTGWLVADEIVSFSGYYGFVPRSVGGKDIHSVALRLDARARGLCVSPGASWVWVYAGLGAVFTFGDGFFLTQPPNVPRGYYTRPTAYRALFAVGSELNLLRDEGGPIASHGAYAELTVLDEYLRVWAFNTESISPLEMLSSTVGYRARFW